MPINPGDTAFIIICTAMVMLMAPAVGLFYGGMVRSKNLISMITLAFVAFAIVTIQWVTVGYSLAFGPDIAGLIGGLDYLFLEGLGTGGDGIPDLLFMVFQLVFAGVTLTIVTSGVAERIKLSSFIVFGILWTTLIYDPLAHWAWGGGWAASFGALDFAGGTVVHISSGFAALALALVIGNRTGFGKYALEPSNIPTTLLGGALLWFGWFAFNAGSALAADGVAVNALVATNIAAASGALSWLVASWVVGKPSSLGMISGAIAGLVAITPACGFVEPIAAIPIGLFAGLVCYGGLILRMRMNLDESLDAWAVHGLGGTWGAVATGIFASATIGGVNGMLYGNPAQVLIQMTDVVAVMLYTFVATFTIAKIIDMTIGLRVSEEEEYVGLDIAQHGESTSV
jgi:Amt family ammonium transporter